MTVALSHGQTLHIEAAHEASTLKIVAGGGRVLMSIRVTDDGPVLQFDGPLRIEAAGDVGIEGERVSIHGRGGVSISSGADLRTFAEGDLLSEARIQTIRSRLGDVEIKANDDVLVRGERIRLNC